MRIGLFLFSVACLGQMVHADLAGTSSYSDTVLTPSNLSHLRVKCSLAVTGQIYNQVLYVPGVVISSVSHDLAIVATLANNVYAFDANSCAQLWTTNLGTTWTGYPGSTVEPFNNIPQIGVMSTPFVDAASSVVYVVNAISTPAWVASKLSLTTGSVITSATITGTVSGTGYTGAGGDPCASGGVLTLCASQHLQRPGLKVNGGFLYVSFGGFTDLPPPHGWVVSLNTSDLSLAHIWCTTPNGWGGGIWGGEPTIDGSGNLYVTTANDGGYNGTTNFSEAVIKLSSTLSVLDWFAPSNNATLDNKDSDVGSNRFVLIAGTNYGILSAKDFNVYVIDTTCMGHLQGSSGCTLQTFKDLASGSTDFYTGAYGVAFANNTLFLPANTSFSSGGNFYAFSWTGSSLTTTPLFSNTNSWGFPGPNELSVTSNAGANAILWMTTSPGTLDGATSPGTLRAINPSTGAEYWNSGSINGLSFNKSKFSSPTPANGKIIVPTQSGVVLVFAPYSASVTLGGGVTANGGVSIQ